MYSQHDDVSPFPHSPTSSSSSLGKENIPPHSTLDFIESTIPSTYTPIHHTAPQNSCVEEVECFQRKYEYSTNSIESRLLRVGETETVMGFDELDVLIKLCNDDDDDDDDVEEEEEELHCPVCGTDISGFTEDERMLHTNHCLDNDQISNSQHDLIGDSDREVQGVVRSIDVSPVVKWLRDLGLDKYEEAFVKEEVDMDSLKCFTEEDLFSIGVTALGPRKKIMNALMELRKGGNHMENVQIEAPASGADGSKSKPGAGMRVRGTKVGSNETSTPSSNKLITDFFAGSNSAARRVSSVSRERQQQESAKQDISSAKKRGATKSPANNRKLKNIPTWCSIPGTRFRVDAFKYLRGDCSHWFLSHFHVDHYQGLTRSFSHGKIYCSLITAKLVNMKIGISWEMLHVLPLNQRTNISGVYVTCFDANHCPGSIIILFEPPNGKAVLHTGDFRFSEEMITLPLLMQSCPIQTLILDTTYCNPQYDFPKQEAVIQFVIEAIQAEAFNPKTLFLIGSYTIGKERLFLEVARFLRRKVHVTREKLRLLECLGFSQEDMQLFTLNPHETNIHVVPMWTLASFKRLKHISSQYTARFSLIVAFSPTGWSFGKGKKKSPGRRWQQGTIIRYEVPYSEHSSYTELKEFVKLVSPENIIPSVNNDGPDSANAMLSLLLSS